MKINNLYHRGKFLSESELLPLEKSCLFCLSENRKTVAVIQKDPDVFLLECMDCSAVSASRMPQANVLDQYYGQYYDQNKSKVTMGNIKKFARHIYEGFSGSLKERPDISILDFGGGNGSISYALAKDYLLGKYDNISITVVDYSETRISECPGIHLKHCSSLSEISDQEKFDLVLASAVVEHIPNPDIVLRKLFSFLKEDGMFYARTPYVLPLMGLLKRFGLSLDFIYPGHLHDFGPMFWDNLVNKLYRNFNLNLLKACPSIVETSFKQDFFKTLLAYIFKFPWRFFPRAYSLVGGWEVFIIKDSQRKA